MSLKHGGSLAPFQNQPKRKPKPAPDDGTFTIKPLLIQKLSRFDRASNTLSLPPRHPRARLGWKVQKDRLLGVDGFMNEKLTKNLDSKRYKLKEQPEYYQKRAATNPITYRNCFPNTHFTEICEEHLTREGDIDPPPRKDVQTFPHLPSKRSVVSAASLQKNFQNRFDIHASEAHLEQGVLAELHCPRAADWRRGLRAHAGSRLEVPAAAGTEVAAGGRNMMAATMNMSTSAPALSMGQSLQRPFTAPTAEQSRGTQPITIGRFSDQCAEVLEDGTDEEDNFDNIKQRLHVSPSDPYTPISVLTLQKLLKESLHRMKLNPEINEVDLRRSHRRGLMNILQHAAVVSFSHPPSHEHTQKKPGKGKGRARPTEESKAAVLRLLVGGWIVHRHTLRHSMSENEDEWMWQILQRDFAGGEEPVEKTESRFRFDYTDQADKVQSDYDGRGLLKVRPDEADSYSESDDDETGAAKSATHQMRTASTSLSSSSSSSSSASPTRAKKKRERSIWSEGESSSEEEEDDELAPVGLPSAVEWVPGVREWLAARQIVGGLIKEAADADMLQWRCDTVRTLLMVSDPESPAQPASAGERIHSDPIKMRSVMSRRDSVVSQQEYKIWALDRAARWRVARAVMHLVLYLQDFEEKHSSSDGNSSSTSTSEAKKGKKKDTKKDARGEAWELEHTLSRKAVEKTKDAQGGEDEDEDDEDEQKLKMLVAGETSARKKKRQELAREREAGSANIYSKILATLTLVLLREGHARHLRIGRAPRALQLLLRGNRHVVTLDLRGAGLRSSSWAVLEHILSDGQLPCLRAMLLDENASDGENDLELPVDTNHGHEGRPDEGEFPICGADARVGDVIFALALGGTGTSAMTSSTRSHASASDTSGSSGGMCGLVELRVAGTGMRARGCDAVTALLLAAEHARSLRLLSLACNALCGVTWQKEDARWKGRVVDGGWRKVCHALATPVSPRVGGRGHGRSLPVKSLNNRPQTAPVAATASEGRAGTGVGTGLLGLYGRERGGGEVAVAEGEETEEVLASVEVPPHGGYATVPLCLPARFYEKRNTPLAYYPDAHFPSSGVGSGGGKYETDTRQASHAVPSPYHVSPHVASPKCRALTCLDVRHCGLREAGVEMLCNALKAGHTRPRRLLLGGNRCGKRGAHFLAWLLSYNRGKLPLTELDLSDNDIGAAGLSMLARGITRRGMQQGCPLQVLNLAGNAMCGLDEYGDGTYHSLGVLHSVAWLVGQNPKTGRKDEYTPTLLTHVDLSRNSIQIADERRLLNLASWAVLEGRAANFELQLTPRKPANLALPDSFF